MLLGALLLYFLRFGYDYGNSDQDEVIPYVLHRLDPALFTQDWFVNIQLSEFSVRTYFVWLIHALSLLLPVWLSVLIIYVATWLAIGAAVYRLAFHFTRDQLPSAAAVVLALLLTPVWTLGGNDLVHSMLVASMVGWAFALWAVYHFLRSRYLLAPVLLGVACWFQALVGLHIAMLLFFIRVIKFARGERAAHSLVGIAAFGMLFALWSSPSLGPIIYQQVFARAVDADPSLFYILAEFRLPHHYLPLSFHLHGVLRFALLAAAGVAALVWQPFRERLHDHDFIVYIIVQIVIFCAIGFLFTEILPILFVAKLQLFKMTVFAKLLFVILISGAISFWLPHRLRNLARSVLRRPRWGMLVVVVLAATAVGLAVSSDGLLRERVRPFVRAESPLGRVQEWARRNTAYGAIFAVPPSISSFRSEAQRTIVINYKAIPYDDEQMVTWFRRLIDMAPVELPKRGGPDLPARLDSAFEALSVQRLVDLARQYRFNYVVRRTPLPPTTSPFREVYRADGWLTYEFNPAIADSVEAPLPDSSRAVVDTAGVSLPEP